jgi:hypothetical protein
MKKVTDQIWDIKAEIKGRTNFEFFETEDCRYGIYFSNIGEYGMMKFVSPVTVWASKNNPKLLFEKNSIKFEYRFSDSCYFLEKSDIIVLMTHCYRLGLFDLLYVLFDFNRDQFALINAPNFDLTETAKGSIRLDIDFRYVYSKDSEENILKDDGKVIHLDNLTWRDFKHLDEICSVQI